MLCWIHGQPCFFFLMLRSVAFVSVAWQQLGPKTKYRAFKQKKRKQRHQKKYRQTRKNQNTQNHALCFVNCK